MRVEANGMAAHFKTALLALALALPIGAGAACAISGGGEPLSPFGGSCTTDKDCQSPLRCTAFDSPGTCVECTSAYGQSVTDGVPSSPACVNGKNVPCADLATTTCGCACAASDYCAVSDDQASGECTPLVQPGGACTGGNFACTTGLCVSCFDGICNDGALSGTCSVPLGAPCTSSADCASCMVVEVDGGSTRWCSEACSAETTVSGADTSSCAAGFECLGTSATQQWGLCYQPCNPPGEAAQACPAGTTCKPYVVDPDQLSSGYACQ